MSSTRSKILFLNCDNAELLIAGAIFLENGTSLLLTPVNMYILVSRTVRYMNVQLVNMNTTQACFCNVRQQFNKYEKCSSVDYTDYKLPFTL